MHIVVKQMENNDYEAFAKITQSAYPGVYSDTPADKKEIIEILNKHESAHDLIYIGAYIDDKLVGGMRFYTFEMNFHGQTIRASGIGSVAVDLLYKKRHVAQSLVEFASEHSKELSIPIITLYPFKASFYHNFGYGYGAPLHNYHVSPTDFKDFRIREGLSYLDTYDFDPLEACYNTFVENNHGMMYKSTIDKFRISRMDQGRILIFEEDEQITGYAIFSQAKIASDNVLRQKINVSEMVYNTPKALKALSSFFHSQKDQVEYIEIHTFDPQFYQFLCGIQHVSEPAQYPLISHKINNTSLGMMYMSLDAAELIEWVEERVEEHLVFNIIYPKKGIEEQVVESFEINPGHLERLELDFSVQSFTSWIMGTISLEQMYFQGNLDCALPQKLKTLDRKFNLDAPQCLNTF